MIFAIGVAYVVTLTSGFVSLGNLRDPLNDPYLAIAELLTIFSALAMVMLMVAIHACAPPRARTFSMTALGWMLATAALTVTVHFVQLTVARRIDPSTVPGFERLFGWHWPSMMWGFEIAAWDLFLGLSLLCAAPVFAGRRYATVRHGLLLSGSLCLAGLLGPALNAMAWRELGIFGYSVVLPLTCLALSRAFASAPSPLADRPPHDDSVIRPEASFV
ncbi:MAG: hypothetical protein ABI912_06335 [Actinomycetota bacterium]